MEFLDNASMDSGLEWLFWKASPEAAYLTVIPRLIPKKWDINEVKMILLKNKVINFDIAKIEASIKAASGQMEKIGPPFEHFDENKRRYLNLRVTPMQVSFSIDSAILKTDYKVTEADISFILAEKSVTYGIDSDIIKEVVSSRVYGQEFIIASATPPVAGQDAVINEILVIDLDNKPFIKEDGTADYKKWDNIRQIKQGDVICTRTPPTPGIPGVSVFGTPLSSSPGEDRALPIGTNTNAIDNETKLVAAIDGFLYRQERDICVSNVYIVKGDVDFKTGNIEYSGDVVVRGNVNADFSITADGDISIEGFVEAASVTSKKGSIFIKGSIFGQNKACIIAGKNITASSTQDAKIIAGELLKVWKQIRSCHIVTKNLEMPSEGQIISSSVFFSGYARCGKIGGKVESVNEFVYVNGEKEQFKKELQAINEFLKKLDITINTLQTKLLSIASAETPVLKNQKQLLTSQLSSCANNKEQSKAKREKLLKLIEFMPDKDALISTYLLYSALKVSIFGSSKEYKEDLSSLKISWKKGTIIMEPM